MRKIKFIFALLFFVQITNAQNKETSTTWDTLLNDVKVRYIYSVKYDALISKPKFGAQLQALNGQSITLRGFFMPIDMTGDLFVLSYNPSNMCFFCNGAGIESIVELNPAEDETKHFTKLKTDNYFEVEGTLRLNADDYDHLIYILDDVEFVELIK